MRSAKLDFYILENKKKKKKGKTKEVSRSVQRRDGVKGGRGRKKEKGTQERTGMTAMPCWVDQRRRTWAAARE